MQPGDCLSSEFSEIKSDISICPVEPYQFYLVPSSLLNKDL